MIHPLAGTTETVRYLNEASSRVAILYSGTYSLVKNELPHTSVKKAIVVSAAEDLSMLYRLLIKKKENCRIEDGALSWQQFIDCGQKYTGPISARKRTTDTTSIMSHTGGTTGVPKAVMLSDNNINAEIFQIGCNLKHCRGEKMLVCLPPFVNYSLTNSMLEPLALGITIVMIPQFDPTKFVDYLKQYRFQHINSIPEYWQALLKIKKIHKADFSCLQHLYYGGEAMNINEENKVNDLLLAGGAKRKLAKGYGSTEMTSAVTATYEACNTEGSLGIPLVKTIGKIVRPGTNEELPYCEEGEICIAGPTVMLGYYNNPQETEQLIHVHADGMRWVHTGDLGYITPDGVIYLTGRIKRILITKGLDGNPTKMFPERIERVIKALPHITECCVIGVPDPEYIHIPAAFITIDDPANWNEAQTMIQSTCTESLPGYMIPRKIELLSEFPRTSRGKVDYRALEKQTEGNLN